MIIIIITIMIITTMTMMVRIIRARGVVSLVATANVGVVPLLLPRSVVLQGPRDPQVPAAWVLQGPQVRVVQGLQDLLAQRVPVV